MLLRRKGEIKMRATLSIFIGLFAYLFCAICVAGPNFGGVAKQVPHQGGLTLKEKPDLVIKQIALSTPKPVVGKRFSVTVTVKNSSGKVIPLNPAGPGVTPEDKYGPSTHHTVPSGGGEARFPGSTSGPTTLLVKIGNEATPRTFSVPSLGPGKTATFTRSYTASNPGNLIITCTVDPANLVKEKSERNNQRTKTVRILNLPDYRVVDFYVKPTSVRAHDQMTIYAVIQNFGESGGKTFMRFDIHGDIPGSNDVVRHEDVPVPYLGPGNKATVSYNFTPMAPGTYTFGGAVNMPARDPESNTHNNAVPKLLQIRVKPAGIDLAIVNISAPSTQRHWYQKFNVKVTVRNIGNKASGPFNVHLYRPHDRAAGLAQGTWVDMTRSCPSLAPNNSCMVEFAFEYHVFMGSFDAKVKVDPEKRVKDIKRSNNNGTIKLKVL